MVGRSAPRPLGCIQPLLDCGGEHADPLVDQLKETEGHDDEKSVYGVELVRVRSSAKEAVGYEQADEGRERKTSFLLKVQGILLLFWSNCV